LFTREARERRRERETLENVYYEAIYTPLIDPMDYTTKAVRLKQLKARITHRHYSEQGKVFLDVEEFDIIEG
jgi:hypothetical protein